jgi:hypothetical protein
MAAIGLPVRKTDLLGERVGTIPAVTTKEMTMFTCTFSTTRGALAAALMVAATALSTPAAAMAYKEAAKLCAKNPNCSLGVRDRSGGHDILVKNPDGTTSIVDCPARGQCVVYNKTAGSKPRPGAAGNVAGVLNDSPGSTAKPSIPANKTQASAINKKVGTLQANARQPGASAKPSGSKKH